MATMKSQSLDELGLPLLHASDSPLADVRKVLIQRRQLGLAGPHSRTLSSIRAIGYDATLINQISELKHIGKSQFDSLRLAGRLDLTTEFVVFKFFRDRLRPEVRMALARFLLQYGVAEFLDVSSARGSKASASPQFDEGKSF